MQALALLAVARTGVSSVLLQAWGCSAEAMAELDRHPDVLRWNNRYCYRGPALPPGDLQAAREKLAEFCRQQLRVQEDSVSEATTYALRCILRLLPTAEAAALVAEESYATACRQAAHALSKADPLGARQLLRMALRVCRPNRNAQHHRAWTHLRLAYLLSTSPSPASALEAIDACLPWFRSQGTGAPLPGLLLLRGWVLRHLGRKGEALATYQAAAELPDIDRVDLATRQAGLLVDLERLDEAQEALAEVACGTPMAARQVAHAWRRIARGRERCDDHGGARRGLAQAMAVLEPWAADPAAAIEMAISRLQDLGLEAHLDGQRLAPAAFRAALNGLRQAEAQAPHAALAYRVEAWREAGRVQRDYGSRAQAASHYRRAVALADSNRSEKLYSLGQLGLVYASQGRLQAAQQTMRAALAMDAGQAWLWRRLYLLNHRLHQHDAAAAVLAEAETGRHDVAWLLREKYDALWRLGRMADALEVAGDGLRRARALLALGRAGEARTALEAEDDEECKAFLAALLIEQGATESGQALANTLAEPRQSVLLERPAPVEHLPPAMQARLRSRTVRLHAMFSSATIQTVRIVPLVLRQDGDPTPWLARARMLADTVADFHRATFPGVVPVEVAEPVDLGTAAVLELFWSYRDMSDNRLQHRLPRRRPGEVFLVACCVAGAECSGVAPLGAAFILTGEHTPRARSVAIHEFYHALLDLPHPDGLQDAADPQSVMGYGCYVPPPGTWLSQHQKALCLTRPGVEARLRRARQLEKSGQLEAALDLHLEARSRDPLHLVPLKRAASLLVRLGRPEAAVRLLESRPQPGPDMRVFCDLASDLARLGYLARARRLLQRVPGAGQAGYSEGQIGRAWMRGRCHALAIPHLERALELEPSFYLVQDLGMAYQGAGRLRDGRRLLRLGLRLKPGSADLWCRLAYGEASRGRFVAARKLLARAESVGSKPRPMRVYAALIDMLQGHWQAARRRLETGARKGRRNQYQWYLLGYVRWSCGDDAGATEAMGRAAGLGFHPEAEAWQRWLTEGPTDAVKRLVGRMRGRVRDDMALLHLAALLWPSRFSVGLQRESPGHPRLKG